MPSAATMQLATLLENFIRENRTGKDRYVRVAEDIGVSYAVLKGFLAGKNPHHENMDKIEDWMKQQGILTRLGLPVAPPDLDQQQLYGMGIVDTSPELNKGKHYVSSAFLEPRTFYSLVAAVLSLPETQREEVLQKLLPHEFPSEA